MRSSISSSNDDESCRAALSTTDSTRGLPNAGGLEGAARSPLRAASRRQREICDPDSLHASPTALAVAPASIAVAVCFATAIDDVQRFESANKVTCYLGLTPGENTNGFKTKRTGMTKAGSSRVRWTLNQAAWTMTRCRPNDPIVQWFKQVAGRRGKKVAITALSRKMAGILYAMWRDQKSYNPSKAVQEQP